MTEQSTKYFVMVYMGDGMRASALCESCVTKEQRELDIRKTKFFDSDQEAIENMGRARFKPEDYQVYPITFPGPVTGLGGAFTDD